MQRHMQRAACIMALCLVCVPAAFAAAGQNRLTDIRYWTSPTFTRLVFDLKSEATWETGEQKDSNRLVLELDGFDGFLPRELLSVNDGIVKKVRALHSSGKIRILIELEKPAEHKIFILKKIDEKPPRLVIDLTRTDLEQAARGERQKTARQKKKGDYIVVIDPGHGGEDPGAVSSGGAYEKDLVLAIGRQLAAQLGATPGVKAYLTRRGDYFIPLGKRVEIAKEYGADLFLSIHVNAGFSTKAAGSSVYCLSFKGASNNVARVAEARENASDSIGGVPLEQQKSNLNVILCDLVQTHTINSSVQLAGLLLGELGKFNKLYLALPQEANFAVLRAPDTPSVLIETDFISSPDREKMLKSREFQNRFVKTVAETVSCYLAGKPQSPAAQTAQGTPPPASSQQEEKKEPAQQAPLPHKAGRQAEPPAEKKSPVAKPAPSFLPQAPEGGKYRIVKKSDTEYALEPVEQAPQQPAGQPVVPAAALPKPGHGATTVRYHVVKKNEGLSSIARQYGLPLQELCQQNNLSPDTKVAAGIKLKIVQRKSPP